MAAKSDKKNIGEWAEVLIFLLLLTLTWSKIKTTTGKDTKPILYVHRPCKSAKNGWMEWRGLTNPDKFQYREYIPNRHKDDGWITVTVPGFKQKLRAGFKRLLKKEGRTFLNPEIMEILSHMGIQDITASNSYKLELGLMFQYDPTPRYYSAKCTLGSAPSLANASPQTGFVFKVELRNPSGIRAGKPKKLFENLKILDIAHYRFPGYDGHISREDMLVFGHLYGVYLCSKVGQFNELISRSVSGALSVLKRSLRENHRVVSGTKLAGERAVGTILEKASLGCNPSRQVPVSKVGAIPSGIIILDKNGDLKVQEYGGAAQYRKHLIDFCFFDSPSSSKYDAYYVYGELEYPFRCADGKIVKKTVDGVDVYYKGRELPHGTRIRVEAEEIIKKEWRWEMTESAKKAAKKKAAGRKGKISKNGVDTEPVWMEGQKKGWPRWKEHRIEDGGYFEMVKEEFGLVVAKRVLGDGQETRLPQPDNFGGFCEAVVQVRMK